MMTALLTSSRRPPDAPVLVTRQAVDMPGSKVGVLPLGRHVPLESMLYGLLLPSGNDAAVALAQHVAGSVNRFVVRMNDEAAKLGLGCTRYSSPSGYYDAGNFSCAADLAVLAHVDMEQPRIARIVRTYSAVLPFPIQGGKLYLYNNNPLLIYKYPGVTGMKTGQTEAAGRCLVATAERHGVRLGAVVLNSDDPGTQAASCWTCGFEDVYHQPLVPEPPFPPGALTAPAAVRRARARWSTVRVERLTGQSAKGGEVDLDDTPEQAAYRAQVRGWLDEHKAEAPILQGPGALEDEDEIVAARRAWQGKLAEGGLAGVTWPKEYGGQGLGPIEQVICNQEIARAKVPGILDAIGVGMLGPTIIAHGAEEQKSRYLGPMLHGDEVWCQLFSEPAAGSDLAAVQARARQQDDGSWRLTGQKVWTTNAQFASYGLLLARTDADVPKHKGLTMFIVPMDAEGVTVRGLRQISGEAEFNEVFFDDVALDAGAVVGGVGNGWGTALTTLMFERVTIGLGGEGMGYNSTRFAAAIAGDEHARRDPEVRHQLGEIASELLAVRFTGYRTLTALQKGQIPGPEAGLAKVTIVSGAIKAGDLIADVLGPDALSQDSEWAYMISFLPGLKSAGGTEEILRNTVGERVLGLPPEPRLDKGIPFSELRSKEGAAA